jgi:hypothetical protein
VKTIISNSRRLPDLALSMRGRRPAPQLCWAVAILALGLVATLPGWRRSDVAVGVQFHVNRHSGNMHVDNYGILYRDLSEKPVYEALQGTLGGC